MFVLQIYKNENNFIIVQEDQRHRYSISLKKSEKEKLHLVS
jgi:hypothetical protein